jgi:hypothetical protein
VAREGGGAALPLYLLYLLYLLYWHESTNTYAREAQGLEECAAERKAEGARGY